MQKRQKKTKDKDIDKDKDKKNVITFMFERQNAFFLSKQPNSIQQFNSKHYFHTQIGEE